MSRFSAVRSWKYKVSEWLSCLEVNNSREATILPLNSPKRTKRLPSYCRTEVLPSLCVTDKGSLPLLIGWRLDFLRRLAGVIGAPRFRMCPNGYYAEC